MSPNDTADYMNVFFMTVGPTLAEAHDAKWCYHGDILGDPSRSISTVVHDLCEKIGILKSFDDIASKISKDTFMVLTHQLVLCLIVHLNRVNSPIPGRSQRSSLFSRGVTVKVWETIDLSPCSPFQVKYWKKLSITNYLTS